MGDALNNGGWSPRASRPAAIIVPVHNAPSELRTCIAALVRNTTHAARVLLIDDASTDPGIAHVLADAQQLDGFEVLRNSVNHGFSATVNRGFRAAHGQDIVVLNSDTVVTPRWLERLVESAYSDPLIATVTPVSDNAGAFSVPAIGVANEVPAFVDYDGASRLIAQHSHRLRPRTPTANGFCMYVKRAVIEEVGDFDAAAFPRGYGEENDFCMRALDRGWHHVVDDSVFIHHVREASFRASKEELIQQGRVVVNARHPQYTGLVREFVASSDMTAVRARVGEAYLDAERFSEQGRGARPRVLFVAHEGRGGTPATNLDLMAGLEHEYDCWLLTCTGRELRLDRMVDGRREPVERHELERTISPLDFSREDYRRAAAQILDRHAIELLHVRHLFKHTFDLPSLAGAKGIPIVFSFHDFYFVCPTVHLLDDQLRYCAGSCTPGLGSCRVPSAALEGLPPLKHRFVHEWREEVERMLADVDAFVTTSPHAREVHLGALPTLEGRRFDVIEHGRDLVGASISVPPEPGRAVRIAVPTTLDIHKGAGLMQAILDHDGSKRIEFHLLGDVPDEYAHLGSNHGPYVRDELPARLSEIRPAFVGIFSIWAETYSHVLSEAWAAGVPVVATALGALRERIERHGGGWLIDPGDPQAAVERILALADDPGEYLRVQAEASARSLRTVEQMSDDYSTLYRRVIDRRRVLVPDRAQPGNRHLGHGVLRAELILPGLDVGFPDSTELRVLRRYQHPSVRGKLHATVQRGAEQPCAPADRDLVIARASAIRPEGVERLLGQLTDYGIPLVLDLDHDPFASGAGAEQDHVPTRLLEAASLLTVASRVLEERLAERGFTTLLVEDMLDERLFFAGPRDEALRTGGPARALYVGSAAEQPATLAAALDCLRADGVAVELTVVDPQDSYSRAISALRKRRHEWDFGLAPIADTSVNRATGDLRYLELTALGLPGAFSDFEPYSSVKHDVTGLLVSDSVEAWSDAIRRLVGDAELRVRLAAAALTEVQSSRLIGHGSDRLLAALFDLASPPASMPARAVQQLSRASA